jgi:hypothetical protein
MYTILKQKKEKIGEINCTEKEKYLQGTVKEEG